MNTQQVEPRLTFIYWSRPYNNNNYHTSYHRYTINADFRGTYYTRTTLYTSPRRNSILHSAVGFAVFKSHHHVVSEEHNRNSIFQFAIHTIMVINYYDVGRKARGRILRTQSFPGCFMAKLTYRGGCGDGDYTLFTYPFMRWLIESTTAWKDDGEGFSAI